MVAGKNVNALEMQQMNTILECANELLDDVNSMLNFVKNQDSLGKCVLQKQHLELKRFTQEIFGYMRNVGESKGLKMSYHWNMEHDQVFVQGDRIKIREVLYNLISNACKFTSKGHVSFSICKTSETNFCFVVQDTGCGISNAFKTKVFEPLTQQDMSISRPHGGIGLGLATSMQHAKLMNGDIQFESMEGKGSTFVLSLQLENSKHEESPTLLYPIEPMRPLPSDCSKRKILVVDDNIINVKLCSQLLKHLNEPHMTAMSGTEAVQLAKEHEFDIILMDAMMPAMDGLTASQQIKENARTMSRAVPYIALVSGSLKETFDANKLIHIDAYYQKPLRMPVLQQILQGMRDCQ